MSSTKTVLITGCSRGIGLGIVKEYINKGFRVIATCRKPDKATELSEILAKNGQRSPLELDTSSLVSVQACKENLLKEISALDVLVNNAGISNKDHPDDLATSVDPQEFDFVMHTNVTGVMMVTQAFIPLLLKANSDPRVINISSSLGSMSSSPRFTTTSYQCSKAALNMLTKCFAYDVQKIVFVAMHPGWVQTDMGSTKNRSPPVPIEESAQGIIKFAHEVPLSKSGCFIGFDGNPIDF